MLVPSKEFLEKFKSIRGAFSVAEAVALINIMQHVPEGGVWCELGTHMGKSAMCAAYGSECVGFELVEPEFGGTIPVGEVADNIAAVSKGKIGLAFIVGYSTDYLKSSNKQYSYLFWDSGDHSEDLVSEEVKVIEHKLVSGGVLGLHDLNNQFVAVRRAYDYLLSTGKFEEIKIDWQPIFDYVAEIGGEEGNNSWHLYPELPHPPNFVGALKRK